VLLRNSQRLIVMALMAAGLTACHASPLVAPSRLAPVTSQAYMPPGGGTAGPSYPHNPVPYYPVNPGPNVGPQPYNPGPGTGRPTGPTGTPKCYPHVPCL
jgi:hypothetical protein